MSAAQSTLPVLKSRMRKIFKSNCNKVRSDAWFIYLLKNQKCDAEEHESLYLFRSIPSPSVFPRLQRVGGHSKRFPPRFKAPFIEQKSSASAATGCLPSFHLRLPLRNSLHLSKIDEKFSCRREAQAMSHKSRIKDETFLREKRSDCFLKFPGPSESAY